MDHRTLMMYSLDLEISADKHDAKKGTITVKAYFDWANGLYTTCLLVEILNTRSFVHLVDQGQAKIS